MVLKKYLLIAAAGLLLLSCNSQNSAEPVNNSEEVTVPADPVALYLRNCESCHGMKGDKGVSNSANLKKSTLSDAEIKKVILYGNDKGMMPYKDIITSETEINALVEYVKSIRE